MCSGAPCVDGSVPNTTWLSSDPSVERARRMDEWRIRDRATFSTVTQAYASRLSTGPDARSWSAIRRPASSNTSVTSSSSPSSGNRCRNLGRIAPSTRWRRVLSGFPPSSKSAWVPNDSMPSPDPAWADADPREARVTSNAFPGGSGFSHASQSIVRFSLMSSIRMISNLPHLPQCIAIKSSRRPSAMLRAEARGLPVRSTTVRRCRTMMQRQIKNEVAICVVEIRTRARMGRRQPAIDARHGTRHVPASEVRWLSVLTDTPVPGQRNRGSCRFREALTVGD